MKGYELKRILRERVLILDGAMGTLLEDRGLVDDKSADALVIAHPEAVFRAHLDYIEAGADVILTDTFGANRARLEKQGLRSHVVDLNRRAVELARRAAEDKALVAACVGPLGERISQEEARKIYAEQLEALLDAAPDMVVIETQTAFAEIEAAVTACRELDSEIALVAHITLGDAMLTYDGLSAREAFGRLRGLGVDVAGVNCIDPADALRALGSLSDDHGPFSVEPYAAAPNKGETIRPEKMADYVQGLVSVGARMIGTCCGSTPEHTRNLKQKVSNLKFQISND